MKDTLSSCSYSDEQDMQQMLKQAKILNGSCLNGLSALKSNFTRKLEQGITKSEFERAFSHIFGEDVDTARPPLYYMLKRIIHAQTIQKRLDDKKLQIQECTVQEVKASDAISEYKAQERCMVSFRQLHSHLKLLSNNDLKGTRTEYGFKRAFATLFGQDVETFTGTMFLNMDQLEKKLNNEEFQETRSMAAFKIIEFHDTLIQHMESVKKSIDKRSLHKKEYDSWVNERHMLTTKEKVDTSKALDASLVVTESSETESKEQDTSSRSENDAHADDVDIRPIYDEEPMAEIQTTAEINVFAIGQQYTEQPEFNNEGEVDQNAEQCHDTCSLPAKLTDNQTTKLSNQSLESENI
ncbi:hypothetical protein Tco_1527821, partial [Tanacetum coccineum]